MRKELNSQRIFWVHQHGRRFIGLEHQYGRRDVMWKRSICKWSRNRCETLLLQLGEGNNEKERGKSKKFPRASLIRFRRYKTINEETKLERLGKVQPRLYSYCLANNVLESHTVSFESLSFDQRRLRIFLLEYRIFHAEKILCSWNNCWSHCLAVSRLHFNLYFLIGLLNNTFFLCCLCEKGLAYGNRRRNSIRHGIFTQDTYHCKEHPNACAVWWARRHFWHAMFSHLFSVSNPIESGHIDSF